MTDSCELLIPGLRLWLSIGCSAEERLSPQPIDIDILLTFPHALAGCESDNLLDVFCYKTLTELVIRSLQNKSFHLIEHLAKTIFDIVAPTLSTKAAIAISVSKAQHSIPYLNKPVVFKYSGRVS